jgi:uncharacterized protein involved in propanediol utilization
VTRRARVEGHFGEWIEGRLGADGPVALVTLPCPALAVTVAWQPARRLAVDGPAAEILPPGRARRLLEELDLPRPGRVEVTADMPAGAGAGASTAALVALARAAGGRSLSAETVAAACLAAEGAVDPLMLPRADAYLWAPRAARPLRNLPRPPTFDVVGGYLGPPIRTDPGDTVLPDILDLVDAWERAAGTCDRAALARLAALSAERTTALRGPADDPTPALAAATGALGHVRAHTGSARGVLFAPGTVPGETEERLAAAGYVGVFAFRTP